MVTIEARPKISEFENPVAVRRELSVCRSHD